MNKNKWFTKEEMQMNSCVSSVLIRFKLISGPRVLTYPLMRPDKGKKGINEK